VKYESIPLPLDLVAALREECIGERNNVLAVREVVVARHEACNGERNNAPTLKMKKWNGDATVL
jgi:hypothetical protein